MINEMVGGPSIPHSTGAYRGGSWAAWHEPLRVTRWTAAPGVATEHHAGQPDRVPDSCADASGNLHTETDWSAVPDGDSDTAMHRGQVGAVRPLQSNANTHTTTSEHTGANDSAMQRDDSAVLPADGRG
jgi:hypothetical protein